MASVFQRKGRRGWYVKWIDGAGKTRVELTPAQTKTAAKRIAAQHEAKAYRQHHGMEALPTDSGTLWETCEWWLKSICPEPSKSINTQRLTKHVKARTIGAMRLAQIKTAHVDGLLNVIESEGGEPATVNKIRSLLQTVFNRAAERPDDRWTGMNPVTHARRRKVPKKSRATLRADEIQAVVDAVPDEWRNFFVVGIYTGERKGELIGLLKSDVDLEAGTMTVARSYENETTKGGHADTIPIAEAAKPFLKAAIDASPSKYVFPAADGTMRKIHLKPQNILRTAMKKAGREGFVEIARLEKIGAPPEAFAAARIKAGLIDGFEHTCRRCTAIVNKGGAELPRGPLSVKHPEPEPRLCENKIGPASAETVCGARLWAEPIARHSVDGNPIRFHDLRHTAGTLMLRAGVHPHHVQRVMRHRDLKTTLGVYAHLDVEDLRGAVNAIGPTLTEAEPAAALAAGTGTDGDGANLVPELLAARADDSDARAFLSNDGAITESGKGELNPRLCLGKAGGSVINALQPTATNSNRSNPNAVARAGAKGRFPRVAPLVTPNGANLVPVLRLAREPLLSVRQVAEQLGVSAATVYAIVERGELPHVRVSSNAIRISRVDLAAFIAGRRSR